MGCGGSKGQGGVDGRMNLGRGVQLFGDYFNSETRAIATILDICEIKYDFHTVDTLNNGHREESYLRINKAGTVPTLIAGDDKIIGGGTSYVLYLRGAFDKVKEHLIPDNESAKIEQLLNWFYMKMMPETQRLIRLIVPPKTQG